MASVRTLFQIAISAKDDASHQSKYLYLRHKLPFSKLARILTKAADGAIPEGMKVVLYNNKNPITAWFAEESDAQRCCEGLEALGEINGVAITVKNEGPQKYSAPHPNSNWIRIHGFHHSVDEHVLREHALSCGLNPKKQVVRIIDLGGSNPRKFKPRVDVECKSRKIATEWIKALRMTTLGGDDYNLWVHHRPAAVLDSGRRLPRWADKKKLTKEQFLETLGKNGARHFQLRDLSPRELKAVAFFASVKKGEPKKRKKGQIKLTQFAEWKKKNEGRKIKGAENKTMDKLYTKFNKLKKKVSRH